MPYDIHNHPSCLFKCLLFACKTIQDPWKYAQVNQFWSEVVRPTESGGLGAKVWMSAPHNFTVLPRRGAMTEHTRIFRENFAAFQNLDTEQLLKQIHENEQNQKKNKNKNHKFFTIINRKVPSRI